MTELGPRLGLLVAAYLIGAIPFGLMIARSRGVDILSVGSGNIGATNVGRVLGRQFFYLCFVLDVLKGLLPTLAFGLLTGVAASPAAADLWWWLAAMIAPVLGHMFSPFLGIRGGLRGGKGVATGLGSMLGLFPILTLPAGVGLLVYLASVKLSRYVGVASCLAAASLPVTVLVLRRLSPAEAPTAWTDAWPAAVVTGLLAVVVIIKHRGNLSRTLRGTEPRVGDPLPAAAERDSTPAG
ncbi:MAG: glycerol-3-phosphate acyltransferase [Planctomycetota bacterium]